MAAAEQGGGEDRSVPAAAVSPQLGPSLPRWARRAGAAPEQVSAAAHHAAL